MEEKNIELWNEGFQEKKKKEMLAFVPEDMKDPVLEILDFEVEEEFRKAADACERLIQQHKGENLHQVQVIFARIFPKVLREDVECANRKFQEDIERYFSFLDQTAMDENMQDYLVETMVRLSELLDNAWFRPLFKEFAMRVGEKQYLKSDAYKKTIDSVFASAESCDYYEDKRVSLVMKYALKTGYERTFMLEDEENELRRNRLIIDALTNAWYLYRYYEGHEDEFSYVEKNYPYSYRTLHLEQADDRNKRQAQEEALLDEMMEHVADDVDRVMLKETLGRSYEKLLEKSENAKENRIVSGNKEGSYRRREGKIGRNDPCPCGSGKKYKFCCGKNRL